MNMKKKEIIKMEKFYLEEVTLYRKEDIVNYINEFLDYDSPINGIGDFKKLKDSINFEQIFYHQINLQNKEYAQKYNSHQSKVMLLIRENDNKLVGTINIRWNLTEALKNKGGNIGYSIRPTERRKGYNKINLYLGLKELQKLNVKEAFLDCYIDNIASKKTIESFEIKPVQANTMNKYYININETIDKFKNTYEQYIYKNPKLNKEELINLINTLKIDKEEFWVLSSGALLLRNIYPFASDLDIAVTNKGLKQLKENYNLVEKPNGWFIVNDKVECVCDGEKENLQYQPECINGIYAQNIDEYLEYLKLSERQKDKDRIELVKKFIKSTKSI